MKKCMLIPGNPAIADHYLIWINEIRQVHPDLDITYATSYVIFDKKLNESEYDSAIRKYYEDIFLGLFDNVKSGEKITIIAHSVGSYFALRLLEKHSDKIEKVIVMFPYIGYSTITSLKYMPILYRIDRYFPLAEIVARSKKYFKVYGEDVHDISNSDLTACLRFGVRQCVYFGRKPLDVTSLADYKDKIHFIYTENDRWCPPETISLLKPISKSRKVDIPHDFIRTHEYRIQMLEQLGEI